MLSDEHQGPLDLLLRYQCPIKALFLSKKALEGLDN